MSVRNKLFSCLAIALIFGACSSPKPSRTIPAASSTSSMLFAPNGK